ncbi:MAG: DUF4190 domain-containing protein [Thermoleophilia bacterium]
MRQPPEKAGGLAIAALVLSIAGLVCCCLTVPSIVGLVLGFVEKGRIARGESSQKGAGMVKAAIILGIIGVAIGVIYWVVNIILQITGTSSQYFYYSS